MQYKQTKIYPSDIFSQIINLERAEFKTDLREIYQGDSEIEIIYVKDEGQIVAYLTYKELDESFDIYMLMVVEEYRKQKIASELLKQLMYKNIILEVRISNEQAIKFYKKNGFKEIRKIKNYYDNHEAGLVMYREIE